MATKELLVKKLRKPGVTRRDASIYVDTIFNTIAILLKKGGSIQIRGFGTFYVKKRAARKTCLNGQTLIPEHRNILFRPCNKLRLAVWDHGASKTE